MKQMFSIHSSFPVLFIAVLLGCSMPSDGADSSKAENSTAKVGELPTENRLSRETSPYLLLHAHNPVDWYPWGPEAFEKAKQEDKPIFLSIGYSSCYWCHVMERLVFSNPKIASVMNENFVNIKVDREERPDVDDIYMTSLQIYFQITGSPQTGGWPLSMFMTPEGKPFAGGTYFPPEDSEGQTGFGTVLTRVLLLWEEHRSAIDSNAELLTEQVRLSMRPGLSLDRPELERQLVIDTIDALKKSYDPEFGGIDFDASSPDSPKFPVPAKLELLQYAAINYDDEQAGEILDHTLRKLTAGGIRDHLAGGFHRYSTDRAWRVPHFEKMLYDNAQLAAVFVEAYRQTGDERYRDVTVDIFDFVLRDMTDPQGGFHSALDAETDEIEGKYYVWTPAEVESILSVEEAKVFKEAYGLNLPEFFEHGYVLHLPTPLSEISDELDIPLADLNERLRNMRGQLLAARDERESPLKDDKVLTSWNGLMISALSHGGDAFGESRYIDAASKAAEFVLSHMRDDDGRLLRTYRADTAKLNAYVDDYAFFIQGLLDLHEATHEEKWLAEASSLAKDQIDLFWDEGGTGFFFTSRHHEELLARTKNAYDSVIPSGNGVSARNLIRLAELTNDLELLTRSREILELFSPAVVRSPRSMTQMALALGEYLNAQKEPSGQPQSQKKPKKPSDLIILAAAETKDPKDPKAKNQRIHPKVYLSVDRLPAGKNCDVMFIIDIVEGWHINTNPAKPDFARPTEIVVKSKHGTKLTKVAFPAGKKLQLEGIDEPFHVYEKQLAVRGLLAVPQMAAGKSEEIEIIVKYQACNDSQCERPTEISLSGKIPVAAVGAAVKPINQKLFNPPKKPVTTNQR